MCVCRGATSGSRGSATLTSSRRRHRRSAQAAPRNPQIGDEIFPKSRFLITIARRKFDIFCAWFVQWCVFVTTYCSAGFSALE